MGLKIFCVAIWSIVGIVNLMSNKISKLSYGLAWSVLMLHLIVNCFE